MTKCNNTPDSITIGGVTISREQFDTIIKCMRIAGCKWEYIVAANQPEHWDGEPCNLPVCEMDVERAKGFRFEYTGKQVSGHTWGLDS